MIVPQHVVGAAVTQAERMAHAEGWDHPPFVLELEAQHINVDGHGAVAVTACDMQMPNTNPLLYLQMLAEELEGGILTDNALVKTMASKPFVGFVIVVESWGRLAADGPPPPGFEGRPYADVPGSREARWAISVDTSGRVISVCRIRGRAPKMDSSIVEDAATLVALLRRAVFAVASRMPLGSADLDAIRGLPHVESD